MRIFKFDSWLSEIGMAKISGMVCILFIALLIGACASNSKQAVSNVNEAGLVSTTADVENDKIDNPYEIECRYRRMTGSRFKEKVCSTKAEWAKLDRKNQKNTQIWKDEMNDASSRHFPEPLDQKGGTYSGNVRH